MARCDAVCGGSVLRQRQKMASQDAQEASDGFAGRRTLALREILDGRPSQAARVLVEAMQSVLVHLAEEQTSSSHRGPKRPCRQAPASASHCVAGLVQQLGRSPPELIAQHIGAGFVQSEWRAAVELLLVSLACSPTATAPALAQADALARYLQAFGIVDAHETENTTSFHCKYGGSAGLPDFAVAVITIVRVS